MKQKTIKALERALNDNTTIGRALVRKYTRELHEYKRLLDDLRE